MSPQGRPKGEYRSAQREGNPISRERPQRVIQARVPFRPAASGGSQPVSASGAARWSFLYALHAIGCVFAWPAGTLRLSLVVVFVAHLVVIGWMWRNVAKSVPDPAFGQTGSFLHAAIVWTAIAAFVATVLTFGPPLLLATCI